MVAVNLKTMLGLLEKEAKGRSISKCPFGVTVSTKILAALQKQDKSVQELSTKMDNNFAGLTEKLESYLAEQQTLRQKKLQTEADFYSGLERQNVALTSIFDNDSKETEEYIKKSNAFNEQMMSLIQAKAKEEETFLKSRYLNMTRNAFLSQ